MKITERQSDKRRATTTICVTPAEALEIIHGLSMGIKMARFSKYNDGKWSQPCIRIDDYRDAIFRVEDEG